MKGLAVPIRAGRNGGAVTLDGNLEDNKIVALALADSSNENPFQANIGLGTDFIFDVADQSVEYKVRGRIIDIFRTFSAQRRFELREQTMTFTNPPGTGELTVEFAYISTEANQERQFRQVFGASKPGTFNGQG